MGIWGPPPPRQDRHRTTPSFSSSLLDAIYRSIDESDTDTAAGEPPNRRDISPEKRTIRPKHSTTSTSSSSSSSSFYFSSSSDADTPMRIKPIRTGPILTRPNPIPSDPQEEHTNQNRSRNKNLTSIKKKLRELRRSAGPTSPGAKLTGFLNSLFHPAAAAGGWNPKKPKVAKEPSPCSSASSYSRSCLSKTPSAKGSAGEKRSVRFCPVGVIVGEDCRPCGEKIVFSSAGEDFPARVRERGNVMEELDFEMEVEDYDSDSTSSEDLFELEINLGGNGSNGSGNGVYRDELPVYETTNLGTNRAIARGLMTL